MVKSLLEGGSAIRHVTHRHLLPLLAAHASDSEQPMLLFPKLALGTLKGLLLKAREPKSGIMVSGHSAVQLVGTVDEGQSDEGYSN